MGMDKMSIIAELARNKVVETMVKNVTYKPLNDDTKDLVQMVYLILLEYDDAKLQDLWNNNQMSFFIARIIINQFRSHNSPYHTIFRKFQERSTDITGMDWSDED
jgi:hypothetical protein